MTDLSTLPGFHKDYQMLTSDLIIKALLIADSRNNYTEDDFPQIRTLLLPNYNICTISNINDFIQLSKLVLTNNSIEILTGLDQLINLEVLDVSFNKLSSLDGIDKLNKLTDLIANNNQITNISGLLKLQDNYKGLTGLAQSSHSLQSINLANNSLPGPLKDTIKILQTFKQLRILVLSNNEFSKESKVNLSIYRKETVAYLPSLKYLDFIVILPDERQKATDAYKTELITLEEKNQLEIKAVQQAIVKTKQIRIDAASDCLGFDTLVDTDILTGDANEKIFQIPAIKMEAVGWFRTEAIATLRQFSKIMRRRRIIRQGEICEFEEFYQIVLDDLIGQTKSIITDYYIGKDFVLNGKAEMRISQREIRELQRKQKNVAEEMDLVGEQKAEAEEQSFQENEEKQEVDDLINQVDQLESSLQLGDLDKNQKVDQSQYVPAGDTQVENLKKTFILNILNQAKKMLNALESEVQYEIQENLDTLTNTLTTIQNKTAEVAQAGFQSFKSLLLQLHEKVQDLLNKALELKLWKESQQQIQNQDQNDDTIADAVDLTSQNQGQMPGSQQQDVQNLLPAEMSPQVLNLLKDKGSITTAAMNAHEHKQGLVEVREDGLIASQKDLVETSIKMIQQCEFERTRRRVLEIQQWYEKEMDFISKL
ncbi:Leucine-rich repeat protein [Spironucleus salmonicida]|uniref:Leucine-rich repeat protein n=1 Tax=Spironucleus salmonicida TaxID=348837 RepID=V6LWY7_9EUKA|nr:Leucine-rich repeat protein [Spironucleus salmonicida]|eukprot:EST49152.1 hypothetical protein SS50377_10364 [Spironucleus salmonicida]